MGNVTNITDPFGGKTRYQYDEVGRRTQRVLPNGIITDWNYDWRDRVTNVVHRNGGGTVLASFAYQRNTDGEPARVTREDGTYLDLQYDGALRLTNEVYRNGAGSVLSSNSYAYDATGNRVRLANSAGTFTNSIQPGYRVTAVRNAADGSTAESYTYDNGGRITGMTRSGVTRALGYNIADQLRAVTNGGTWVTYAHDGVGRRTLATNSAGVVRRFVAANTPGTELASPHLISDQSGNVQQGFVYFGDQPLMRFGATGAPVYYLEDALGSVAALADTGGVKIATFEYDSFGGLRGGSGATNMLAAVGGDFRFHGMWFEAETSFYHARAREYDFRIGRFLSRDASMGEFERPETLNPYAFAFNNPLAFSDRSGLWSISEIFSVQGIQKMMQGLKGAAVQKARREVLERLGEAIKDVAMNKLSAVLSPHLAAWLQGIKFEQAVREAICTFANGYGGYFFFEAALDPSGDPRSPGISCNDVDQNGKFKKSPRKGIRNVKGTAWPDFIIGDKPPISDGTIHTTWVVGDIKRSTKTLYDGYLKGGRKTGQFNAMIKYGVRHTYARAVFFIVAMKSPGKQYQTVEATIMRKAMAAHGLAYVDTLLDGKGNRRKR